MILLDRECRSVSLELVRRHSYMNPFTPPLKNPELVMFALDPVPMNFIVFYKPPLTVAPDVNSVRSLSAIPRNNEGSVLLQNSTLCES